MQIELRAENCTQDSMASQSIGEIIEPNHRFVLGSELHHPQPAQPGRPSVASSGSILVD